MRPSPIHQGVFITYWYSRQAVASSYDVLPRWPTDVFIFFPVMIVYVYIGGSPLRCFSLLASLDSVIITGLQIWK